MYKKDEESMKKDEKRRSLIFNSCLYVMAELIVYDFLFYQSKIKHIKSSIMIPKQTVNKSTIRRHHIYYK